MQWNITREQRKFEKSIVRMYRNVVHGVLVLFVDGLWSILHSSVKRRRDFQKEIKFYSRKIYCDKNPKILIFKSFNVYYCLWLPRYGGM